MSGFLVSLSEELGRSTALHRVPLGAVCLCWAASQQRWKCKVFSQGVRWRGRSPLLTSRGLSHHSRFFNYYFRGMFVFPLHFFKEYLKLIVILYLGHFLHWSLTAVLRPLSGDSSLITPSSSVISLIQWNS